MPCLVWESPEGRFVHELDRAVLVIGREEVSDIVILEPAVSRRHALLQVDGERVTVTDLGSSSGTRINGAKLMPDLPSSLEPGDFILSLGDAHIYLNHLEQVDTQLSRDTFPLPVMQINPARKDLFEFVYEDFELQNYQCHAGIRAPISV